MFIPIPVVVRNKMSVLHLLTVLLLFSGVLATEDPDVNLDDRQMDMLVRTCEFNS